MGILIAAVGLFVGFGSAYLLSEDVRYLTRAGFEETRILTSARPIEELARDTSLPMTRRAALQLVLDARDYADSMGFEAGDTYTRFTDVGRDTLLLVLSATPKDCICPVIWKYPIVGRIPYKGFFDPAMARKEEGRLAAKGYDTYLRPSGAFSTLGWFNDPLLSTALYRDSVEMAALVFHEIAHNTLYVKSATPFNESFAQLAGYRTAEEFFRSQGDSVLAARARARWADEMILGNLYDELVSRLERFYATKPAPAALDSGRTAIAQWFRDELEGPTGARLSFNVGRLAERPINNAALVGVRIYRTHLDWFDRWDRRHGRDIRTSVAELKRLMEGAKGDEAFRRLAEALGEAPHPP